MAVVPLSLKVYCPSLILQTCQLQVVSTCAQHTFLKVYKDFACLIWGVAAAGIAMSQQHWWVKVEASQEST